MTDSTSDEQPPKDDRPTDEEPPNETPGGMAGLIPQEIFDQLPEPQQRFIQSFSAFGAFPMQNPMMAQVRPEHIATALANHGKIAELQSKDNHENRLLVGFVILATIVVILALSLLGHSADLTLLFQYGFPFLGGIGVGFGASEYRHRE